MPEISFITEQRKINVDSGVNLREAAIKEFVSVYPHIFKILNCRGQAMCGTCAVEIVSGRVDPAGDEEKKKIAKKLGKNSNIRLACQVIVKEDITVRTHA